MNFAAPDNESSSSNDSGLIKGSVEIELEYSVWAERDRALVYIWSDETALVEEALSDYRHGRLKERRTRDDSKKKLIQVNLYYGAELVICSKLAQIGGVLCFTLLHSGAHLEPKAFSIQYNSESLENDADIVVRAKITLRVRQKTATELLMQELFPKPQEQYQTYPRFTELFALKQALSQL